MPTYTSITKPTTTYDSYERPNCNLLINATDFLLINSTDFLITTTNEDDIYTSITKPA